MVFIAFVTRCHSVALRSLTSRRTRTLSGARQGQLGQLVPQQGVAGKAAAPTASRTNPTFFMGHRSALLLQYADRLLALTRQKLREDVHVTNAFHTQCSFPKCSSICLNIRGVIPSSIRAFPPIKNCVRVSSRVVEGQQVVTCKERTGCSEQPKW